MTEYTMENVDQFIGKEIGVSSWVLVDQDRINAFAECTGDHQWIHVDTERAARDSPLGTTIGHGFLTLSLLPMLSYEVGVVPGGIAHVLNYGADKIRFLNPVKAGSRVRARIELVEATEKRPGQVLLKTRTTMEIENEEKPAMVAETLSLVFKA